MNTRSESSKIGLVAALLTAAWGIYYIVRGVALTWPAAPTSEMIVHLLVSGGICAGAAAALFVRSVRGPMGFGRALLCWLGGGFVGMGIPLAVSVVLAEGATLYASLSALVLLVVALAIGGLLLQRGFRERK
jgi:uncharacterized membrane protein